MEKLIKYLGIILISALLAPLVVMLVKSFIPTNDNKTTLLQQRETDLPSTVYLTKCSSCHGVSGHGDEGIPELAGQSSDTLRTKLLGYKYGNTNGAMKLQASGLSDEMIEQISHYIATFKSNKNMKTQDNNSQEKRKELKFDTTGMNS